MSNFLQETIADIERSGHAPEDIIFIGSRESGHSCTWDEFRTLADFDYDSGFGAQKVASDLIIAFKDGATMWRYEYDGSEQWQFSEQFRMPTNTRPITRLHVTNEQVGWRTLAQIETND